MTAETPLVDPVPTAIPQAVLFCCDYNAVRSPMAEGILKKLYGRRIFVQSAGVKNDLDIDGFSVAVCAEIGVQLDRHKVRTFQEMEEWGDQIGAFDLIVALSPAAQRVALEYTRWHAIDVEYWPTYDPTGLGDSREAKLAAYRQTRDQIQGRILKRFGPPDPDVEPGDPQPQSGQDETCSGAPVSGRRSDRS